MLQWVARDMPPKHVLPSAPSGMRFKAVDKTHLRLFKNRKIGRCHCEICVWAMVTKKSDKVSGNCCMRSPSGSGIGPSQKTRRV